MKKPADQFLSLLHARFMKSAGFKKNGNTFSRAHEDYAEHFNFQGSAWNSPDAPWRFYINCAISFPDLPLRSAGTGLWKYHSHARLGHICSDSPSQFDVSEDDKVQTAELVARLLRNCSDYFLRRHQTLRDSYLNQRFSSGFLLDPELNG